MSAYDAVMILFAVSGGYFALRSYRHDKAYTANTLETLDWTPCLAYGILAGTLLIGAAVMFVRGFFT